MPTLVDRDLVLYSSQIIMEYLDERFPHPPYCLLSCCTAKARLTMYRIDSDWYALCHKLQTGASSEAEKTKKL